MAAWHTPDSIRADWPDAETIPDDLLDQLLVVAQDAVVAYAPVYKPVYEPATLTWPDGTAAFTRQGDHVTVSVTITGTNWSADLLVPDGFVPAGTGIITFYLAADYRGEVKGVDYHDPAFAGRATFAGGAASFTVEWLGDSVASDGIPDRYRVAQMIQVKNVWNASMASVTGDLGGETFALQPRPLDWHVKALLRPAQGRPRVG